MIPLQCVRHNDTAAFWAIFAASCVACLWIDAVRTPEAKGLARQGILGGEAGGGGVSGAGVGEGGARRGINLVPVLSMVTLGIMMLATRKDPALLMGLTQGAIARVPWAAVSATVALAFLSGRVVQGVLLPGLTSRLIREGILVPGGSFSLLTEQPLWLSLSAGVPYIGCQTFAEELFFRGVVYISLRRLCGEIGPFQVATARVWPDAAAALLQAILFGAVHFLPVYATFRKHGVQADLMLWYVMLMPAACAFVFVLMNHAGGSLWPGWIAHWALNYTDLCWIVAGRANMRPGRESMLRAYVP